MSTPKLSRQKAHRTLLGRNLLTSLILSKRIVTTQAKARFLQPLADGLLRSARHANDATKRRLAQQLTNNQAVKELFNVVVPELPTTNGSLTRLIKVEARVGDQAPQAALVIKRQPPVTPTKTTTKNTTKTVKKPV